MSSSMPKSDSIQIRDVWAQNLDSEFELIRGIVDKYNYVAMDTEFPGVVLAPLGEFKNSTDRSYFALRENANIMKLIQLGLTFTDENGNLPTCGTDKYCVWQFNFREFNPDDDICMPNSVELLRGSGIDFVRNKEEGVDSARFGELLMPSDVVLSDKIHWVTFHGGYDFGYLLKLLKGGDLPETQEEFFVLIKLLFPILYDIKHLMTFAGLYGGLNKLAEVLGVERVGTSHQAGSDSLLTSFTFRKLREKYFSDGSVEKYSGVVYGLGVEN